MGWTQADLAEEAKLSTAEISRIEAGIRSEVGPLTLHKLATAFAKSDYGSEYDAWLSGLVRAAITKEAP